MLKNAHYVHPFNVQNVKIVHTYQLYAGKMMGPPCDLSIHDVIVIAIGDDYRFAFFGLVTKFWLKFQGLFY